MDTEAPESLQLCWPEARLPSPVLWACPGQNNSMNSNRYEIIWLLNLLEFHEQLHHVPLRCSDATGRLSLWCGHWGWFVSKSSLGQCWTCWRTGLQFRGVQQAGAMGQQDLGSSAQTNAKSCTWARKSPCVSAGWDWLSRQQLCRNRPQGLVDRLYVSHRGILWWMETTSWAVLTWVLSAHGGKWLCHSAQHS